MISKITIGSDPEFFIIKDLKDAHEVIPAYEIINGTKYDPIDFGEGYKVLVDNVLVEGNIPPASSKEEFVKNMKTLKGIINGHFLAEFNCKLEEVSSNELSEEALFDPRANEFGCSPYLDAWGQKEVRLREIKSSRRPAGMHIHAGYELNKSCKFDKETVNLALVRAFDLFVIRKFDKIHKDSFRDKYYGGYGKYRHTSYGVEFRSLGGYFTKDEYLGEVYDSTIKAINYCKNEEHIEQLLTMTPDMIENTILEEEVITIEL